MKAEKKEYNGLITHVLPDSLVAEQFRTIRTNINFAMVDKKLKSLVITSAAPDAGKTTVASNLAAIFAMQGHQVLLVEGDLRRPSIHRVLNLANDKGVTSLLSNAELIVEECVKATEISGLSVLTCGPIPPNPAELIASNRMKELQEKLVSLYDLVIFDTPPLLGFSDAQILSSQVDGTVFVIRYGVAKKENMFKVNEVFKKVGANVLGTVYNQVPDRDLDNSYYYDYLAE